MEWNLYCATGWVWSAFFNFIDHLKRILIYQNNRIVTEINVKVQAAYYNRG